MFVQDNQRSMHFCLVKQWSWDLNKSSSTVTFIMYHNWLIWLQSLHIQYYLKRHEYSFHLHSTQFLSIQVLLSYTARWCPKPLHFLTRWISRLLGLALASWATATVHQCWCPSPFPFAFHISVFFHSLFFTCHSYDRRIRTHSIDPSLTHFLGEFQGLGLTLVPHVLTPEAEQGCTWSRHLNQFSNFRPDRGFNRYRNRNLKTSKALLNS